jgi:hypothetical protein
VETPIFHEQKTAGLAKYQQSPHNAHSFRDAFSILAFSIDKYSRRLVPIIEHSPAPLVYRTAIVGRRSTEIRNQLVETFEFSIEWGVRGKALRVVMIRQFQSPRVA